MKKRLLLSLCLLAVITVAAAILILGENDSALADSHKLSEIQPSALSTIVIQRDNAEEIVVEKNEARWMLVSPLVARANPDRVASLLALAGTTSHARLARGDTPLSRYGLEPAPVTLQLDGHSFYFGNTDPIDERRYLLFRDRIHLIEDGLFYQLRQKAEFFVSTMLVPENEQIISIDFNGQRLEKQKNLWRLSSASSAVGSEQLAEIVDNWTRAHARQVLAYNSAEAMQKITLSFSSGRTIRFDIVSTAPGLALGRADLGLQYLLEKAPGSRLLLPGPASNTPRHKQDKEFPG